MNGSGTARGPVLALALALFASAYLAYVPALENGFVDYDDGAYVTKNADVSAGLTLAGLRWAFTETHASNWHPLTWLSHMLDCELFGLDPRRHHAMAVGLHALNAALCLIALHALTKRLWPSVAVAALFALHPLRVESVAWIAERKDVLSGTFFFLTLIAYARHARVRTAGSLALVALALALGLLAKQMLVTLPFLLLVLDGWPLGRFGSEPARRLVLEKLPLVGLALASGVLTLLAQGGGGAIQSFEVIPFGVRVANAVVAYVAYVGRALWPVDLAVFYPHAWVVARESFSALGAQVLASSAALLAATALAWRFRRRHPSLLVGWLWFLGTALPVIGIVQVGSQWMADRYAYLPHVGLYVAVLFAFERGRAARVAAGVGVALALLCVPLVRAQIRVWKDTYTLFEHALAVTERNYVAEVNVGFIQHRRGELDEAERHYRAALSIAPHMPDAHTNLAGILLVRGRLDDAREHLALVNRNDPGFISAWMLLAQVEDLAGRPEAALEACRSGVRYSPDAVDAQCELARRLVVSDRPEEAVALLTELAPVHPNHLGVRLALARSLAASGRPRDAASALEGVLEREPTNAEARVELAWIHATTRDEGLRRPERALGLIESLPVVATTLRVRAAALAAAGRFEEAERAFARALEVARPDERSELLPLREAITRREALRE